MTHVEAIYEHGAFYPTEPLPLVDGARVRLVVVNEGERGGPLPAIAPEAAARQRRELAALQRQLAALPVEGHRDGFSGSDHDQLLYKSP